MAEGRIIAICNQKGGVGKTTLTMHLAVAAARAGRRVCCVDSDSQGNLSSWLTDAEAGLSGIFDLLVVGKSLGQVVRHLKRWHLGLLPGDARTAEAMIFLGATAKPFGTIAAALAPLATMFDLVLVDMPPSRAAGFAELLYGCDSIVVPTRLERLSLEGVALMANTIQHIEEEHGRGPQLLGIVPNSVKVRTKEHQFQMGALVDAFGPSVWPPVPASIRVPETCSLGKVLFDAAPNDSVTLALAKVAQRFLEVV
jgi:chromosome partitioning protein